MDRKAFDLIPGQSIRYLIVCGAGVALLFLLAVYPSHEALRKAEAHIAGLEAEIAEQNTLGPLFQNLLKELREIGDPPFPLPEPSPLALEQLEDLMVQIDAIARGHGMEMQTIRPEPGSPGTGERMPLSLRFLGGWSNLRDFLIQIYALGCVEKIEQLQILSAGKEKLFDLTLLILTKTQTVEG